MTLLLSYWAVNGIISYTHFMCVCLLRVCVCVLLTGNQSRLLLLWECKCYDDEINADFIRTIFWIKALIRGEAGKCHGHPQYIGCGTWNIHIPFEPIKKFFFWFIVYRYLWIVPEVVRNLSHLHIRAEWIKSLKVSTFISNFNVTSIAVGG